MYASNHKGMCFAKKSWSLISLAPVTLNIYVFFSFSVHRYGNSKEHMTVAELKMFLETEQKVKNVFFPFFVLSTS